MIAMIVVIFVTKTILNEKINVQLRASLTERATKIKPVINEIYKYDSAIKLHEYFIYL